MKDGWIKVAAVTPKIRVADPRYNRERICRGISEAYETGARILVFPELCLTGYTCGDLFLQDRLLAEARAQLSEIILHTRGMHALIFIGLPIEKEGKLYNAAAVIADGRLLALIPKRNIPGYGEFYETRHFTPGSRRAEDFLWEESSIPFGTDILFRADTPEGLVVGCEICEDLWAADSPGTHHALAGANVLVNLSASDETIGKDAYREMLVKSASARLAAGYIYCSAGEGESTQDLVFGGHNIIAENGSILTQKKQFVCNTLYSELDISRLRFERRRMNTWPAAKTEGYQILEFHLESEETELTRRIAGMPFVPADRTERAARCEEILSIQSYGLKKRLKHTGCRKAVIGISGGLDSTLALLATARTFDLLSLDRRGMIAVTMPCFGTTDRTYDNACKLSAALGLTLEEVNIRNAVHTHFRDIGQDEENHDVTYENSQARERTQVLMDIANRENGLVIGTGDMSELALGWATYNGDHMSMYGINGGVPKTLVRHLVRYCADVSQDEALRQVLLDILDTPVSPELLPPVDGKISQKTEDLVGPYELHDFFLYYMLRFGFSPAKLYRIARYAFAGAYEDAVILNWMKTFYRRFFSQQFKRSCLPDGPKVGSVALSPRGDLRMPSDACISAWQKELDEIS